jgi:hypothetical protein
MTKKKQKVCEYSGLPLSKVAGRYAVKVGPEHPYANNRGYVLRARYLMEKCIGRYLDTNEHVHHIDGNPKNDRISNLRIVTTVEFLRKEKKDRRKLDYDLIKTLRSQGFGYKRIAKMTGYIRESIRSACKTLEKAMIIETSVKKFLYR